ncbi:hypothetical protein IAQ61_001309 [Plenodomus lingam]|uniref:uncharacterized protein n=1 Tax=Leptosphaeria maculans TaxID=5022 RepID=UPI003327DFE4|nr:hypothetical protein IAQ61_001309 [Plenodomus lingam]
MLALRKHQKDWAETILSVLDGWSPSHGRPLHPPDWIKFSRQSPCLFCRCMNSGFREANGRFRGPQPQPECSSHEQASSWQRVGGCCSVPHVLITPYPTNVGDLMCFFHRIFQSKNQLAIAETAYCRDKAMLGEGRFMIATTSTLTTPIKSSQWDPSSLILVWRVGQLCCCCNLLPRHGGKISANANGCQCGPSNLGSNGGPLPPSCQARSD